MVPSGLHLLSISSLIVAGFCTVIIAGNELRHPQKMWIMNLVWPLCALFGSVFWLWFYFRFGRKERKAANGPGGETPSFLITAAKATSHCGSGCTLGDICAESLLVAVPGLAILFGYGSLFHQRLFANWVLDFLVAYGFGILFQYFTIAPMRHLTFWKGLWAAIKADTLSLTAWQVGMYGFMVAAHFWLFQDRLHIPLQARMPEFWFMMQIAMIFGFLTSFPVNIVLLKVGLKEAM